MSDSETLSIFDYTDYRRFLLDHYEGEKQRWSDFSYNVWARKLELKNNTSIIKIIKGQRNAGQDIGDKLCDYFQFKKNEREYFHGLVRLQKVQDDPELKVYLLQDLQKLNFKNKRLLIDNRKFESISSPWYFAFRQLANIQGIPEDLFGLKKIFRKKIDLHRIKEIMKNLIDLRLLVREGKSFKSSEFYINTEDDTGSEALKRFHEEALTLAKEAIREIDPKEREISGLTLTFSQKDLVAAKKMIRDFQDRFVGEFGGRPNANQVYQFQHQLFPLSEVVNKGDQDESPTLH